MSTVIKVENLSKKYIIRHESRERYTALRDVITNSAKNLGSRIINPFSIQPKNNEIEEFWALKDVSFEVKQGERIGIIGRNGAGKSTLLKLLSRITEPTEGKISLTGRVSSLLEVGTGFHPELTGRENIYLNGAILGMSKVEINNKFDEIVDFSGVEKFLDTPVKRYSSGMQVRLAFAVAAHLEPEILLVDEVLAVGDAAFQKKCLGKMEAISSEGRTILFVSHNLVAISSLCSKGVLLESGKVKEIGPVDTVVSNYLTNSTLQPKVKLSEIKERKGEGRIKIVDFKMFDLEENRLDYLCTGQSVELRIYYECFNNPNPRNISFTFAIFDQHGIGITSFSNYWTKGFPVLPQKGHVSCYIKKFPLTNRYYRCNFLIYQNQVLQDWLIDALTLQVEVGDFFGTGIIGDHSKSLVLVDQKWATL